MDSDVVEGAGALASDPHWKVVQKVAASASFQKSPRLQELLLYICERALLNCPDDLREPLIGCRIFGRSPDYSPGEDNIVRVEVRRLRKRLEQYSASEGVQDPIVISIPKGSYLPCFEPRETPSVPMEPAAAETAVAPPPWRVEHPAVSDTRSRWVGFTLALAVLFAALALWRLAGRVQPVATAARGDLMSPAERLPLWPVLFNHDENTLIVCADSALVVAQSLRGSPVPLEDYVRRDYAGHGNPVSEATRNLFGQLSAWQMTDVADVRVVDRLHRTNPDAWDRTTIQTARTTRMDDFTMGNVVLLGSTRSNPWNSLFEQRLNFRIDWDEQSQRPVVRNKAPAPGKPDVYRTTGSTEYGTVAFVPNLRNLGNVLMIAGTNGRATEAVGDYLTNMAGYSQLMKLITAGNHGELPYFEALLESGTLAGAPKDIEIVAVRIIVPGPAKKPS